MKTNIFPQNCNSFCDVEDKLNKGWTVICKLSDGREYEIGHKVDDEDGLYFYVSAHFDYFTYGEAGEALSFVLSHDGIIDVSFK